MIKFHPVAFEFFWDKYKKDTSFKSWHDEKHFAYQAIVEMGKDAIPHLLNKLGKGWLAPLALCEITGESPINPEHAGMYDKINEDWFCWAKNNGY